MERGRLCAMPDDEYKPATIYFGPAGSTPGAPMSSSSVSVSSINIDGVTFVSGTDPRVKELQDHIDAIMEVETAQKEALYEQIRKRDIMIQSVIDLHQPDKNPPNICRECLDRYPCPTLRAVGES
jgi:hypothetical protein